MKQGVTIFSLWVKAFLAVAIIALVSGGAWFYHDQEQEIRKRIENDLSSIARLKTDQISAWRKDQLEDAAHFQEHPFLSASALRFIAEESEENKRELYVRLRSLADQHGYVDILVVALDGKPLFGLLDRGEDYRGYRSTLAETLRGRMPAFTELHMEGPDVSPHISVVAPLYNATGPGTEPFAALVLITDASQFLFPLVQFWPTASETAETLLVRRDGDEVLFLNELRHQQDTALKLRIPLSRTDVPAVMAVLGRRGQFLGKDYRGVEVVSVILPVPDSPWFMVSKIDAAEAFAEWRFRSVLMLGLLFGLMACIVTTGLVFWQRDKKARYRALYLSESALRANVERHSITLRAIGDAVISTDALGMVEFINPVAEALTGWKQDEARGRPMREVFHIISEVTREPSEDPVAKVLREGIVVGLANHTILISRDGTERPIADSGAPIRAETGEIIGVVLVFRDQSAEHEAREELQRSMERQRFLSDIIENAQQPVAVGYPDGRIGVFNRAFCELTGYDREELKEKDWNETLTPPEWRQSEAEALTETARNGKPVRYEKEYLGKDGTRIPIELLVHAIRNETGETQYYYAFVTDITRRKQVEAEREKLQGQLIQAQKMEAVGRLAGGVAHDYNNILSVIIGYSELAMEKVGAEDPLQEDLKEIYTAANRSRDITRQLLAFARKETIAPKVLDLNETVENMLKILRKLIGEDIDLVWHPGKVLWPVLMDPSQLDQILANLCINARDAIADVGRITIETSPATIDADYCSEHAGFMPGDFVLLAVSDDGSGMDRETMENIFEPFFTTKGVGKGTGLGLATVYGIVKQNNGFINVYSEPGRGTTFRIYLPGHSGDISGKQTPVDEQVANGKGETVLVVEDETSILKLAERILSGCNYNVLSAKNPSEALEIAHAHSSEIALLLTDVVMPEMNGRELADRLKTLLSRDQVLIHVRLHR